MLIRIILVAVALLSLGVQADDCLVSTSAPAQLSSLEGVISADHLENLGIYRVAFSSGEQILASYGVCELSLKSHYLLRRENGPSDEQVIRFFSAMFPSQDRALPLLAEIKLKLPLTANTPLKLGDSSEAHVLTLKAATSPLYTHELHYQWQPPLH